CNSVWCSKSDRSSCVCKVSISKSCCATCCHCGCGEINSCRSTNCARVSCHNSWCCTDGNSNRYWCRYATCGERSDDIICSACCDGVWCSKSDSSSCVSKVSISQTCCATCRHCGCSEINSSRSTNCARVRGHNSWCCTDSNSNRYRC